MTLQPSSGAPLPVVLHADDQPLIIDSVARLLHGHVTMLPPVTSLRELDERMQAERQIDILLLDLVFGHETALPRLRRYHSASPALRILVLTGHWGLRVCQQCIAAGAAGVLAKPFTISEIHDAIADVHAGGVYLSPAIGTLEDVLSRELAGVDEVTLQVLALARCRVPDKQIAAALGITIKGVQYHKSILRKVRGLPPGPIDWTLV